MHACRSKLFLLASIAAATNSLAAPPVRLPKVEGATSAIAAQDVATEGVANVLLQPDGISNAPVHASFAVEALPSTDATSETNLDQLEQLAVSGNPAIAQASARVAALRGMWIQVGLPPNPSIGYAASEIGNEGTAGQQGGYVGQEFITGGKLGLNRAVLSAEIMRAEQLLEAARLRTLTDVRIAYYAALVAQRRADLAEELVRIGEEATSTSRDLLAAQEITRAGLLQSEVEQQNAIILSKTAANQQDAALRQLSAVVGAELPSQRLSDNIEELPKLLNWEEELVRITTTSPEVAAAMAEVVRSQNAVVRARREPIPDVSTQLMVQKDNSTGDTITGVQVGIPLPIWDRNQGGIRQAEAEVSQARRNAARIEFDLRRRLAIEFQQYADARIQAETYATEIVPKAKETFSLVQRGYQLGELGYLELLTAQRTYSQTNLAYLDALRDLWTSWSQLRGLLLSGSLNETPVQ